MLEVPFEYTYSRCKALPHPFQGAYPEVDNRHSEQPHSTHQATPMEHTFPPSTIDDEVSSSEPFEASTFFRTAVEQSPSSVVITDRNGNIQYVNPKFERLTGYSRDEVMGRNPRVLNSGYTPKDGYQTMWQTILGGDTWRGVFRNRKKNGDVYWESASISPMRNRDGDITHFMAIKEDITKQRAHEQRLRAAIRTLHAQKEEMDRTMEEARATQQYLLPQNFPDMGGTSVYARNDPADMIGGDHYDLARIDETRMAFLVADVTGHGVSAALVSCLLSSEFRNALSRDICPRRVLADVNDALQHTVPDGHFASAAIGVLDTSTGELRYGLAGHPDLLLRRASDGRVEQLSTDGFLLGLAPGDVAGFETGTTMLEDGDTVLAFTDAFIEAQQPGSADLLGFEGFTRMVESHAHLPLRELVDSLYYETLRFSAVESLPDDATLLAIRYGVAST